MPIKSQDPLQAAIRRCRIRVRRGLAKAHGITWSGIPTDCDGCGRPLTPATEFLADVEIAEGGDTWGLLCPVCLIGDGHAVGWGHAQLYQYQSDSQCWLLVAGFMPTSSSPGF